MAKFKAQVYNNLILKPIIMRSAQINQDTFVIQKEKKATLLFTYIYIYIYIGYKFINHTRRNITWYEI
jgi:hypothetical protein